MARYRLYLADAKDFVQSTVTIECSSKDTALNYARTLIKQNGRIELWSDVTAAGPWIGPLQLHPEAFSSA